MRTTTWELCDADAVVLVGGKASLTCCMCQHTVGKSVSKLKSTDNTRVSQSSSRFHVYLEGLDSRHLSDWDDMLSVEASFILLFSIPLPQLDTSHV